MIEDLKNGKPIRVIYDGEDFGIYEYNREKRRYEGIIGYLDANGLNKILKGEIKFIEIRSVEDV